MSDSNNDINSRPFRLKKCKNFEFIAFWSKKITNFFNLIEKTGSNAHVTHHDLLVKFVNKEYLNDAGEMDHKKREKGSKHDDLTTSSDIIEFKFRSNALESLPGVLRSAEEIFKRNDLIHFAYFRKRLKKDKTKIIKTRGCIYYLIIIIFSKDVKRLNLKALLKEVKREEMEFTKEVAKQSGIDMDDEELYAVGNMINEIKLERELEEKDKALEEKDEALKEKDEALKEKDEALEEKDKTLEEKDKIIKQLKEQIKSK